MYKHVLLGFLLITKRQQWEEQRQYLEIKGVTEGSKIPQRPEFIYQIKPN
jgi:hypothetical protein